MKAEENLAMTKKLALLLIVTLLALLITACGASDLLHALDEAEEYLASQEQSEAELSADPDGASANDGTIVDNDGTMAEDETNAAVSEEGQYSDPTSVALYLHTFGHLPDNYITKAEAEALGWESSLGNLWEVAQGKSIGGDKFGNREGLLPRAEGRQYYECDVNYEGGYRGGERLVYSNDGLIFYSDDHYASYTQLY